MYKDSKRAHELLHSNWACGIRHHLLFFPQDILKTFSLEHPVAGQSCSLASSTSSFTFGRLLPPSPPFSSLSHSPLMPLKLNGQVGERRKKSTLKEGLAKKLPAGERRDLPPFLVGREMTSLILLGKVSFGGGGGGVAG